MNKRFQEVLSYIFIIAGALLASFAVVCILLPNDAIDYGTAGIAIIISMKTGFNLSLCVFFVFLPFMVAGFAILGMKFGMKALVGSVVYTVGLELFELVPFELNTEHFIAVAFGGAILGAGLALILRHGGCIDGSEIFANIVIKKLSELEIHNASGNCCIVCLGIGEELREGVWDMDTDRELLQFAMENILNEILGDNGIALHENASMTVVFLFRCVSEKQAGEQIRNCISVLEETLFVRIDSGIGKIYDSVSGLYQSLTEAKQNYEQNVFYHTHYLREVGADDSYPYPEAIEQELLATITFSGDLHQDAITLVNQWFEQCRREKSISRSRAISVWSLMLAMLTKKISQLNVEHFNRQNADGWKRLLEQSKTILDLQEQVLGSLEQFFDAIREESRSRADRIVRQIINYIDENLEQDLSLGMLANQVSLSPGYLAVLLKKHLGTNHSKYITQRRLERAKQLLKHTDKRIGEIAEMVGYSDVRYFNKVFKQNIGCKPSDYRKKNHI